MNKLEIHAITNLNSEQINLLIETSRKEGFRFLTRFKKNWIEGVNRFDKEKEKFYLIKFERKIVGLGGVNNNPFSENESIGRLRHLYVFPKYRRKGIGKAFVRFILKEYQTKYKKIRLRTDSEQAAKFYESLGFKKQIPKFSSHEYYF